MPISNLFSEPAPIHRRPPDCSNVRSSFSGERYVNVWNSQLCQLMSATFNHMYCTKDHLLSKIYIHDDDDKWSLLDGCLYLQKCLDYITGVQLSRLRLQWFQCKHKWFVRDAEDKIHLGLIVDADEVGSHQLTFFTRRNLIHFIRSIRYIVAVFVVVLPVRLARETWTMSQQNQIGNGRLLLPHIALRWSSVAELLFSRNEVDAKYSILPIVSK